MPSLRTRFAFNLKLTIAPALLGVLSLSLLAGCGGGGGGNGNGGGTTNSGTTTTGTNSTGTTGIPSTNSLSVTTSSGLVATLSQPSGTVGVGGTVVYTLTISNPTGGAVAIQSASQSAPTAPAATLVVRDAAGNKVYEPIPGTPALFVTTLASGQTLSATVAVSTYGTQGTYTATANFAETIPATSVGPLTVTAR